MAYVEKISHEESTGLLRRVFDRRVAGAGRLWQIVQIQGQNPESLRESMRMYGAVMFGESPLSRAQREMIAVVTSAANECEY